MTLMHVDCRGCWEVIGAVVVMTDKQVYKVRDKVTKEISKMVGSRMNGWSWWMCSNSRNGAIIMQRDHKYATPETWNQFYVFLATAPTGVLTAGTAGSRYIVYLWENKGVAPLRELLYWWWCSAGRGCWGGDWPHWGVGGQLCGSVVGELWIFFRFDFWSVPIASLGLRVCFNWKWTSLQTEDNLW